MAARDRYTSKVVCPKCGQEGVLHISEDDHPYMRNPHRAVDEIEGEFKAAVTKGVQIAVICTMCSAKFVH
jgi:hypothetical protein